jgi:hypothetical protein
MEALCGVVILITMLSNYTGGYDRLIGHAGKLPVTISLGYLSLQMFFAIAAWQWLHEINAHEAWPGYGFARLSRFMPAVVPAVLASYLVGHGAGIEKLFVDISALPANLVMAADFLGLPDFQGAFWRLKIEVMFSVGLGVVWFGLGRRVAVCVLAVCLAFCACRTHGEPVREPVVSAGGILTMDGYLPQLTWGVALYFLAAGRHVGLWRVLAAVSGALVLMAGGLSHGLPVLGALLLIGLAAHGWLPFLAGFGWLTGLGRIFFPVFLVHQGPGFAVIHGIEAMGGSPALAIAAACATAVLGGFAIHRYCMRPVQSRLPLLLGRLQGFGVAEGLRSETPA